MSAWPWLGLGLAAGALVVSGCGSGLARPPTAAQREDAAIGLTLLPRAHEHPLPELSGSTLAGTPLTSSAYSHGRPLVINVWASWCTPCRAELPLLARASLRGVRVLGIDERDTTSRARALARSTGASYPSLVDPGGDLLARLPSLPRDGIPSTLVVAADGRPVARIVGALTASSLRRALAEVAS